MTLSENIYNLVHTVDNYFIAIRALNAHGSKATQPISPHRREVFKSTLDERAAEHDVEGMTARMDATFELDVFGVISWKLFSFNTSITTAAVFIDFSTCAALN